MRAKKGVSLAIGVVLVLGAGLLSGCRIVPNHTYTGEGTFYHGDGAGNCSFEATGTSSLFAAMNEYDYENAAICGGFVRAKGPLGTVTVKIVDRCPECAPGDIDFSPTAFARIANPIDGRVPISWELVSGGSIGNITYKVKDGSSQWWIGFRVDNHRNLVTALEVQVGSTWQALQRQQYNYFLAPSGLGVGPFTIRVTDNHGEQKVSSGITLSPEVVQPTTVQFAAH
jgi:expansin (peptidoglycan-binding protein)